MNQQRMPRLSAHLSEGGGGAGADVNSVKEHCRQQASRVSMPKGQSRGRKPRGGRPEVDGEESELFGPAPVSRNVLEHREYKGV